MHEVWGICYDGEFDIRYEAQPPQNEGLRRTYVRMRL